MFEVCAALNTNLNLGCGRAVGGDRTFQISIPWCLTTRILKLLHAISLNLPRHSQDIAHAVHVMLSVCSYVCFSDIVQYGMCCGLCGFVFLG